MIDPELICESGKHIMTEEEKGVLSCPCDELEALKLLMIDHDHPELEDACDCQEIEEEIKKLEKQIASESVIL